MLRWLEADKTCCWVVPRTLFDRAQNDNRGKQIKHNSVPSFTVKQDRTEICSRNIIVWMKSDCHGFSSEAALPIFFCSSS